MLRWSIPLSVVFALAGCAPPPPVGDTDLEDTDGPSQPDADEDTIIDVHEGSADPDADGLGNADDRDSDGDVIRDKVEAGDEDPLTLPIDSDGDLLPDYLDLDSDDNCITDAIESGRTDGGANDTDGDGLRDFADDDNDGDTIPDVAEIGDIALCDPTDTDGDGTPDLMDIDSDGDGIGDLYEAGTTLFDSSPSDSDGDGTPDFQDTDSDDDGMDDEAESGVGSPDQEPVDTDADGKYDFQDADADGDGLGDFEEVVTYDTDPYDFDSDGDGFSDGSEILADTDPNDSESIIEGVYVVVSERAETEENFVFELKIQRGDIAVITDTTGSMSATISAVKTTFTTILDDVSTTFEDVAGAAGGFDDYAYSPYGSSNLDKPFYVKSPVTTDFALVQAGVNGLSLHGGGDLPESGMEALYQAATGAGYDQDCDGIYDASTDVVPFLSNASDPFNGTSTDFYDATYPDIGVRGGFGFREYSLPILIYVIDDYLRDPESTNTYLNGSPSGCPIDAGKSDVVAAVNDIGGYLIAVDVSSSGSKPTPQMTELAQLTSSVADMDDDGTADDYLVYKLNQSSPSYATDFSNYVVKAVEQLVASITFEEISLEIEGDTYGFVTDVSPTSYTNIDWENTEELVFTLNFLGTVAATEEDQIFLLTLNIIGDGTTLLGTRDIVVLVPGTSY